MPYIPQLVALTINKHIRFTYTAILPVQKLAVLDSSGHMVFFLMQVMRLLVTDVVASCAETQRRDRGRTLRPTVRC